MQHYLQLLGQTPSPQLPGVVPYQNWYWNWQNNMNSEVSRFISQQTQIQQERKRHKRLLKLYRIALIVLSGMVGATLVLISLLLHRQRDTGYGGS
jgi:hypothetical protein